MRNTFAGVVKAVRNDPRDDAEAIAAAAIAHRITRIVVESLRADERGAPRDLLTEAGYRVARPGTGATTRWDAFMTSNKCNFLAF